MSSGAGSWDRVKSMLGDRHVALGRHWSYNLRNDPKRLPFVLSRYKFAAKMACSGRRVLELGCSEGLGALILGEHALRYCGIDSDADAIETARRNWTDPRFEFVLGDFLGERLGRFDTVVSLDVVEHIEPARDSLFFDALVEHLGEDGIAVVGTPNAAAEAHQSEASRRGHVNLFHAERLLERLRGCFEFVFPFGANDEVVHTGFAPMCHYLLALACQPKRQAGCP
jgi:2-polyprenyl-3-methyl-5-hydroxy-6-metoxy-1,4-benzoquinol methylase